MCCAFGTTDFWLGSDAAFMKSDERQKQLMRFGYADNKPNALGEEKASDSKLIRIPGWFQ